LCWDTVPYNCSVYVRKLSFFIDLKDVHCRAVPVARKSLDLDPVSCAVCIPLLELSSFLSKSDIVDMAV